MHQPSAETVASIKRNDVSYSSHSSRASSYGLSCPFVNVYREYSGTTEQRVALYEVELLSEILGSAHAPRTSRGTNEQRSLALRRRVEDAVEKRKGVGGGGKKEKREKREWKGVIERDKSTGNASADFP